MYYVPYIMKTALINSNVFTKYLRVIYVIINMFSLREYIHKVFESSIFSKRKPTFSIFKSR